MRKWTRAQTVALLVTVCVLPVAAAQSQDRDMTALRAEVEQRFDVLPLRDGLALRPKNPLRDVRSIEVAAGLIAIDGQPVSGAELRQKLGGSADLVLRLSYLDADARRSLFSANTVPPAPVIPSVPDTPSSVSAAPPAERPDSPERPRRRNRDGRSGDRVRIGGSATVREDEVVQGDVVAIGGVATVDGHVFGDVVGVGGGVRLGPRAWVTGNVVSVGGPLRRDPAARIDGDVQEVGLGSFNFRDANWSAWPFFPGWGSSVFALVGTLARLAVLCLLCALVTLFGREYAERAGARATTEPLKSGAIGLLAQLLFVPITVIVVVVLVLTVIGIPLLLLLPFALLGLAVIGLVGFTGVASRIGAFALNRFGSPVDNPYITTLTGVVIVLAPLLLARLIGIGGGVFVPVTFGLRLVGVLGEYLVWTIGFGAVALARFKRLPALTPDHAQAA